MSVYRLPSPYWQQMGKGSNYFFENRESSFSNYLTSQMTDVEAGGATVFPYVGARVKPRKVIWKYP